MSDTSGASAPHHPAWDMAGGQLVVHCPDCGWAQLLDEDLHEEYTDVLLDWHAEHPGDGVNHLAAPADRLIVPAYVRWRETNGCAAVGDERTGAAVLFNHECLAIFRSVAADGGLEAAVIANARRLDISPSAARGDIVFIAADLYRKGLLAPAGAVQ